MSTKRTLFLAVAVLAIVPLGLVAQRATKVYLEDSGDKQVVASGGEVEVQSGGQIDVESGGALKLAGTSVSATAAQINAVTGSSLTGGSTTSAADALAIAVTHRIVQKTTGADAEALTLANGVAGQRLTVILVTDGGGDGTLTPATKTGFVNVVLADAGDHVTFEYVNDTLGWIILGAAGVAAPPVIALS